MRADNLKVVYDFDNSAFVDAFTQRGFYVANCSQSNYAYTELSLGSSLNANYLDTLGASSDTEADALVENSSVHEFLKEPGIYGRRLRNGIYLVPMGRGGCLLPIYAAPIPVKQL